MLLLPLLFQLRISLVLHTFSSHLLMFCGLSAAGQGVEVLCLIVLVGVCNWVVRVVNWPLIMVALTVLSPCSQPHTHRQTAL